VLSNIKVKKMSFNFKPVGSSVAFRSGASTPGSHLRSGGNTPPPQQSLVPPQPTTSRYQPHPEHRERLRRFYQQVNPAKVSQVDEILESFAGEEDQMFQALEEKYKVSTQLPAAARREETSSVKLAQTQAFTPLQQQNPNQQNQSSITAIPEAEHKVITVNLPDMGVVQHYTAEMLPQMQKAILQVQEAYAKLAESIAIANAKGVDVSKSATWVVSAQLGASNFIANAKQFMSLASDEERRMQDVYNQLSSAVNAVAASGGANVRINQTKHHASPGGRQQQDQNNNSIFDPLKNQRSMGSKKTKDNRVVFDVQPVAGEKHVVHDLIHSHAHAGDLIILHPGIYYENLVIRSDIEIRVASTANSSATTVLSPDGSRKTRPDAKQTANLTSADATQEVIFVPADASMPTVQVVGEARCTISGIHFCKKDRDENPLTDATHYSETGPAQQDGVPHISTTGRSQTRLENCTFTSGGGGVVCVGSSRLNTSMCVFRGIAFAGIYAKDQAVVELVDTRCSNCEVGLRVRDATLNLLRCEIIESVSDGVVLHAAANGELERVVVSDSGANGILCSSASNIVLTDTRLISNTKWGLDAPRGAEFKVVRGMMVKNGAGPMSRQPAR
jgi:hypothetical protein